TLLLMMCPEHANICGSAGWSKKNVREYIYQQCRISAKRLLHKHRNMTGVICPQWRYLLKLSDAELDRLMLPVMENTSDIEIVVVGGAAGKNMIYRGQAAPSLVAIDGRA